MGLTLEAWVEKTVHRMDTHWLSSTEKVPGAAVSNEGHADSLLGHWRPYNYWFHWKWYDS